MFAMYALNGISNDGAMMSLRRHLVGIRILCYVATLANANIRRSSFGSHGMMCNELPHSQGHLLISISWNMKWEFNAEPIGLAD